MIIVVMIVKYLVLITDIWILEMFNDDFNDDRKVLGPYD